VQIARFLPPRLLPPSIYVNLRNHRKLLIADNRVAFAGGMNIGDHHTSTDERPLAVSDVHFALRGPVVTELTEVFCKDWHFATGKSFNVDAAEHDIPDGDMHCRVIPDGPDDQLDALAATIQTVISTATKSIDVMTPYFLPGRELMSSLESAALRGVRVRIVLPQKSNLSYVVWALRNMLAVMLRWDIVACYQPPPFCHAKLLCIDDDYSLFGSANLDTRSLRLNFELGVEVFSRALNEELTAFIDRAIADSQPASYEYLASRPLGIRLRDSAAALLSPYF
jgi:cardiolipin synthase